MIRLFTQVSGEPGPGQEQTELMGRRRAPENVSFVGHLSDHELVPLMQHCLAAVFPSWDAFGLIPVEVMACGRPVIAFARGGALQTVVPGITGEFFQEQSSPDSVREAVERFVPCAYDSGRIRAHAEQWDTGEFRRRLIAAVDRLATHPR